MWRLESVWARISFVVGSLALLFVLGLLALGLFLGSGSAGDFDGPNDALESAVFDGDLSRVERIARTADEASLSIGLVWALEANESQIFSSLVELGATPTHWTTVERAIRTSVDREDAVSWALAWTSSEFPQCQLTSEVNARERLASLSALAASEDMAELADVLEGHDGFC